MNETKGPLQQHLHLNAGASPAYAQVRATIMEYYRTTMAFTRLQQPSSAVSSNLGGGTAPMDIGATYKGVKGKGKGKYKGNNKGKGKGYNSKGKGYGYGKRLRHEQQRKVKRKSTMAARTTEQRTQRQRKEQRRQQRKRKESDVRMLHLWPTWSSCKRLQNNGVQLVRDSARASARCNRTMV